MTNPRIVCVLFGPPGQGSFNEAGARACGELQARGIEIEVAYVAERSAVARAEALARMCERGVQFLVAHGGQGDEPVAAVAALFPGLRFAVSQGSIIAPNVACYEVLQEHSAFLAGVLAASITRTGIVAHLSGDRVRPGLKARAAYAHGVCVAAPPVRILTGFCGNQHDPALAERCVDRYAAAGADVLFAMIDGGRPGAIAACRRHGIAQIGNVLDWTTREPDVFIASALADSGWGIRRAVLDYIAGELRCGAVRTIGLDDPTVVALQLADRVPQEPRAIVDTFRERLLSGRVETAADYTGPEFDLPQADA